MVEFAAFLLGTAVGPTACGPTARGPTLIADCALAPSARARTNPRVIVFFMEVYLFTLICVFFYDLRPCGESITSKALTLCRTRLAIFLFHR